MTNLQAGVPGRDARLPKEQRAEASLSKDVHRHRLTVSTLHFIVARHSSGLDGGSD
jgi:hypothetical protein